MDVESTTGTVSLILGHGTHNEEICKSVPRNVASNSNFLVSTKCLKHKEDIKCDDGGSWVNNGIRKVYIHIHNEKNHKKMKVDVIKRGGKAPDDQCWCLTRTYFILKQSKDFKTIIVTLQSQLDYTGLQSLTLSSIYHIYFIDVTGMNMENQIVRYHFTNEEHTVYYPRFLMETRGGGSTPYKRQLQSTRDLLKVAAKTSKPQEACVQVEEQLGGIDKVPSTSALPHNKQQVASIHRNLFQCSSFSDPIMAIVDLYKTEFPEFVRALQILPSPSCILATDKQLQELLLNCTQQNYFGVMHLDLTFNLGNFFVTPIVFPLVRYVHRKTSGGSPSFVGPVLLHHQITHGTYSYFLNHLVALKPEIRQVKAVGTDGELALCNSLRDNIPQAVHLRCLKHIKDAIEHKLQDLKFDEESVHMIIADVFSVVSDGVQELGLSDAIDPDDFYAKLMSLEEKWNTVEKDH